MGTCVNFRRPFFIAPSSGSLSHNPLVCSSFSWPTWTWLLAALPSGSLSHSPSCLARLIQPPWSAPSFQRGLGLAAPPVLQSRSCLLLRDWDNDCSHLFPFSWDYRVMQLPTQISENCCHRKVVCVTTVDSRADIPITVHQHRYMIWNLTQKRNWVYTQREQVNNLTHSTDLQHWNVSNMKRLLFSFPKRILPQPSEPLICKQACLFYR